MKEIFISDNDNDELRLKQVKDQIFDKFTICKSYSVAYDAYGATVTEHLNDTDYVDHMYIRYKGQNFLRNQKICLEGERDFLTTFDYKKEGLDFYGRSMEPKVLIRIKNTNKFELKYYSPIEVKYYTTDNKEMFNFYSKKLDIDAEMYIPSDARVKYYKFDHFTVAIRDNKVIKTIEYDEYEDTKVLYINQYDDNNILIVKNIDGVVVPIIDIDYEYDTEYSYNNLKYGNPLLNGQYIKYLNGLDCIYGLDVFGGVCTIGRHSMLISPGYVTSIPVLDSNQGERRRIYLYKGILPFNKRDLVFSKDIYYLDIIYVDKNNITTGTMERYIGYFKEEE